MIKASHNRLPFFLIMDAGKQTVSIHSNGQDTDLFTSKPIGITEESQQFFGGELISEIVILVLPDSNED